MNKKSIASLIFSILAIIISFFTLVIISKQVATPLGSTYGPMTAFTSATRTVVGTTATQVLSANPGRSYALFTNDSDTAIYLNFSAASTTVASYAVRVNANGGVYEMSAAFDNLYSGEVWASSSVATKTLFTLVK